MKQLCIGRCAMETITETIITEFNKWLVINPKTPGGSGMGVGYTINLVDLYEQKSTKDYVVIAA